METPFYNILDVWNHFMPFLPDSFEKLAKVKPELTQLIIMPEGTHKNLIDFPQFSEAMKTILTD